MEQKARALSNGLSAVFPSARIEYRYENMLHKFRFEYNGRPHWLYVAADFVADHSEDELVANLSRWSIPAVFRGSANSRWIFLSEAGVCDVDDNFGRGS
ncbi:MAG: hypothetical protein ACYDC8_08665 [Gammaproteobacteria bacterium]